MSENLQQHRTLSAEECAELAGVSVDTIQKYVQIGLLLVAAEVNGQSHFLENDIRSLFYTRKSNPLVDKDLPPSSIELASEGINLEPQQIVEEEADSSKIVSMQDFKSNETVNTADVTEDSSSFTEEDSPESTSNNHIVDNVSIESGSEPSAVQAEQAEFTATASNVVDEIRREAQDNSTSELNRALLDQIETLKEERDWLRTRVEQLELRGEREQMLLLSESETVRRLVAQPSLTERVMRTFRLPWNQTSSSNDC